MMHLATRSCIYTTGLIKTQTAVLICSHGTQTGVIGKGPAPVMDS